MAQQLSTAEEEARKMQESLAANAAAFDSRLTEAETQRAQAESALDTAKMEAAEAIRALKEENGRSLNEIETLEDTLERYLTTINDLEAKFTEEKSKQASYRRKVKELTGENETLDEQLKKCHAEIESLKQNSSLLKKQVEKAVAELQAEKDRCTALETKIEELKTQYREAMRQRGIIQTKLEVLERRAKEEQDAQGDVDSVRAQLDECNETVARLAQQLSTAEEEARKMQESLAAKAVAFERQIETAEAQRSRRKPLWKRQGGSS